MGKLMIQYNKSAIARFRTKTVVGQLVLKLNLKKIVNYRIYLIVICTFFTDFTYNLFLAAKGIAHNVSKFPVVPVIEITIHHIDSIQLA